MKEESTHHAVEMRQALRTQALELNVGQIRHLLPRRSVASLSEYLSEC